jgi:hypothetical protein
MKKRWFVIVLVISLAALAAAGAALAAALLAPDAPGLWITRLTPTGAAGQPFDTLEIQFSAPVLTDTFTLADLRFSGPGGPITPTALTWLGADIAQLSLGGQTGLNTYSLVISPTLLDTNNQPLDQNHNGTGGEPGDAYPAALFAAGLTLAEGDPTYQGQNIVIYSGSPSIAGEHSFASLALLGNATLSHPATNASHVYSLSLTITDTLWITGSAKIDVTARGYLPGYTIGNTTVGGATDASGGSYGGLGYAHSGATNWVYGDYRNPNEPGSGGGIGAGFNGCAGGGLVRISAGTVILDGALRADGGEVPGSCGYNNGGSGGAIYLSVGALSGSGLISADGGIGYHAGWGGGSAGGGRIAVYYTTLADFDLASQITAHAGAAYEDAGAVGTVYLEQTGGEGLLRLDSHGTTTQLWTPLGMTGESVFTVDHLLLSGYGVIAAPEHQMPILANNVSIYSSASLTHRPTTIIDTFSLQVTVTDTLLISATGKIDVTARGYLPGYTFGNTTTGGATDQSGGSYGGLGHSHLGAPNWIYGDYRNPVEPGSGGGVGTGFNGCPGGGVVHISAGTAIIDGALRSDGGETPGSCSANNGGSGGAIHLTVGALSGSGVISADGGLGYHAFWAGGDGGGGRIAVYYTTLDSFNPAAQVTALAGTAAGNAGAVGTVYLKQAGGEGVLRLDSHGTTTGVWTPLGMSSETAFTVDHLLLSGSGVVVAPEHEMPVFANNLTILNQATLTHRPTTAEQVYSLNVTITNTLWISGSAQIDVTGRGYLPGYTFGNTTAGGATDQSGGSYGGLGYSHQGAANWIYGDYRYPTEPGSGGGVGAGFNGCPGGGVAHISAGAAIIDGALRSDGGEIPGSCSANNGGSGGAIYLSTGSLSGSGVISADGGRGYHAFWAGGDGGGGRIAIYYAVSQDMVSTHITALDGGYDGGAQPGTVYISGAAAYRWGAPASAAFHGTQTLAWETLGVLPVGAKVSVTAYGQGQAYALGQDLPPRLYPAWDTTAVPDGVYELRAEFTHPTQGLLGTARRLVTINNSVVWHSGCLTAPETWLANQIHVVDAPLAVSTGVTLTLEPGIVVKFAPGLRLGVEAGARLEAQGAPGAPVLLTTLADDTGGDTNGDGIQTIPTAGSWDGIFASAGGQVVQNNDTVLHYALVFHNGALSASETWDATLSHVLLSHVTVPAGMTLTVEPGAVVKLYQWVELNVAAGGQLIAQGSVAQPVYFTSYRDDTVGGDLLRDGDLTVPAAGDWRWIEINDGQATFDHAVLSYGAGTQSGNWDGTSMLRVDGSTVMTMTNSLIHEGYFGGLMVAGGVSYLQNSVIAVTERAIDGQGGTITVLNSTLDANRLGIWHHGANISVQNSLITNSGQAGVHFGLSGGYVFLAYNDVWSLTGVNYEGMADPTGTNGNISVNPGYRGAEQGNYHLKFVSPAIDAADGLVALATDALDAPRYDDPRTPNTGQPTGSGAYADLGAYEFVETAPSDLDLVVNWVSGPLEVTAGEYVTLTWSVVNVGSARVTGPWYDRVALTGTQTTSSGLPLLAGDVLVGQGVTLGPGESYQASGRVRAPGGLPGTYTWQVTANIRRTVFEGQNQANNTGLALAETVLDLPELTVGGAALSGQFAEAGQAHWFRIVAPEGEDLLIQLDSLGNLGRVELYLGCGFFPTPEAFTAQHTEPDAADVSLYLPAGPAQTCYGMFQAATLPGGTEDWQLSARVLTFELTDVTPRVFGASGYINLDVSGGHLDQAETFAMVSASGTPYSATVFGLANPTLAHVVFDVNGLPAGFYDLRMSDGVHTATLPGALLVEAPEEPNLWIELLGPDRVASYRTYDYYLMYGNDSNSPAPASWLRFWVPRELAILDIGGLGFYEERVCEICAEDILNVFLPPLGPHEQYQAPVKLQVGKPGFYYLRVHSLTLGYDLSSIFTDVDPSITINTEILSSIPDEYLQAVLHVADSLGVDDINFEMTIIHNTAPISATMLVTETVDGAEWLFMASTPAAGTGQGMNAPQGTWDTVKIGIQYGKTAYQKITKSQQVNQKADMAVTQAELANRMFEKGWITEAERDRLLRENEGGLVANGITEIVAASPVGSTYGGFLSAVAAPMGQSFDADLINIVRLDPNSDLMDICAKYGIDPYNDLDAASKLKEALANELEIARLRAIRNKRINVVGSADPNDKTGAQGAGEEHFITANEPLRYSISFENVITATAPAQVVLITDTLDLAYLDPSTFELGPMIFGDTLITPPPGLSEYHTRLDLRPEQDLLVQVDATLEISTGLVTWRFMALDPATLALPEDPLIGFLPPNAAPPAGQGSVFFTIKPWPGLPSGTVIENQATITFDANPPIQTPMWSNILDAVAPTSSVTALPAVSPASFELSWSGSDDLSGIAYYDIYVSVDGGPYTLWRSAITTTQATFTGAYGHTYSFYSVAADAAGNHQPTPSAAQASTLVPYTVFLPVVLRNH